jgi:DNA ligase-1
MSTAERLLTAARPPLLLAQNWDGTEVRGWWVSEKLDGLRAYWDGKQFLSRQGNAFHAPDWFTAGLPDVALDGELWIGRRQFQRTMSVVRRQDKGEGWRDVRFQVFDAPQCGGPFEARLGFVAEAIGAKNSPACVHAHHRCTGMADLQDQLRRVEAIGGEGLMLRQPGSIYEPHRSPTLLKVKRFHDAEAVVLAHLAGKGKHAGRLGALLVRLPDGTEFSIGTGFSDKERAAPPAPGSSITFRFQELTNGGVPRFASFVRIGAAA